MATELLLLSREPERWLDWLLALLLAWLVGGVIIFFASGLGHYLGNKGLIAIERLMGMVLITVAIQTLLTGVRMALQE